MSRRFTCILGLAVAAALPIAGGNSQAAIIGTTGAVTIIPGPASVNDGALESNTQIFAFAELQNISLRTSIPIDVSVPGPVPSSPTNDNLSPATLAAGTMISSYYFHCDVVGTPGVPLELTGSATFDSDILGIIVQQNTLNVTRLYPGLPNTAYSQISGLELNTSAGPDSIVLSADRRTVSMDFITGTSVDDIRVITAAVPEPASLAVLGLGALTCFSRRRQRKY